MPVLIKGVVNVNFIAIGLFLSGLHLCDQTRKWFIKSSGQFQMWFSRPCTLPLYSTRLRVPVFQITTRVKAFSQSIAEPSCTMFTRPSKFLALSIAACACDDDIRCQGTNHVVHGEICELNNRTKEAKPQDFTDDHTNVYMNKFRKTGFQRVVCPNVNPSVFYNGKTEFQVVTSLRWL